MVHRIRTVWAVVIALSIGPGGLVGCSLTGTGPLQALSAGGQPIVDGASVEVPPGRSADFTAFVFNPLNSPVTLLSAAAVPLPGSTRAGRLVHVGISTTNGFAGSDDGWPAPGVPTRELAGAQIGHGQSNIVFGITGDVAGHNYSVAGLKIRYRYRGQIYTVTAWSAAVACVVTVITRREACPDAGAHAQAKVENMIGESP
jgi:hypothetical protein